MLRINDHITIADSPQRPVVVLLHRTGTQYIADGIHGGTRDNVISDETRGGGGASGVVAGGGLPGLPPGRWGSATGSKDYGDS
jgi:hypothetical protein